MKLLVGLGNPGKRYAKTRHNVGFMVIDALFDALGSANFSSWELSKKFNAFVCGGTYKGKKIILAKPQTFMNHSGEAVVRIAQFYKVSAEDILVVHDEKDLPLGEIRLQEDRGHAGHNGVRSIIEHLGTKQFVRLRIGIGAANPRKMEDTARFVLGRFGFLEKADLERVIKQSVEKLTVLLD